MKRRVAAGAVALALLGSAGSTPGAEPPDETAVLTLEHCVQLGLDHATEVLKARHQSETSGVALLQGYAQFLPTVRTDDTYGRTWGNEYVTIAQPELVQSDSYGGTINLSASLNVFNGFADVASYRAAARLDKAAELSLEHARQDVALDIAQSYLQVILDQEFVRIDASALRLSRERQDYLAEQARVGSRTYVDLYQQEAQTSASESALISAKNKTRDDLLLLLQKIRVDLRKDYRVAAISLDTTTVRAYGDEPALLDEALARRPDLAAARATWLAADSGKTVARAAYYPTLAVGFSAASAAERYHREIVNGVDFRPADQQSLGAQFSEHINYTFGAGLSWLLFDRLSTKLLSARADQAERDARVDYEDAEILVERDVRRAYGDYAAAVEELRAARTGLEAASLAYEAMSARYEVGAAGFLDLITAQDVYVAAQAAEAQAAVSVRLQERVIDFALGRLPSGGS